MRMKSITGRDSSINPAVFSRAAEILKSWKGETYTFGENILDAVGGHAVRFGSKAILVASSGSRKWNEPALEQIKSSLGHHRVSFEIINGARPNCPREDVYRIALHAARSRAEMIIALGGGSTLDGAKAAAVLNTYSPSSVADILGVDQARRIRSIPISGREWSPGSKRRPENRSCRS